MNISFVVFLISIYFGGGEQGSNDHRTLKIMD